MSNLKQTLLDTLFEPTERDRQRRIGPSNLATTCARCLADSMLGEQGRSTAYELTTTVGTAVHAYLEALVSRLHPDMVTEGRVVVDEVEGYGLVKGTADLYDPESRTLVDYKTTSLKKVKSYRNGYTTLDDGRVEFYNDTLLRYYRQIHLYAYGRGDVDTVALWFIPRDGFNRADTLWLEFPYDMNVAPAIIDTASEVYLYAQENGSDSIESNPECFTCMTTGRI